MDFSTPRKILNSYREGFVGSICDPEDTAKLMNEKFINIKVDREERPD